MMQIEKAGWIASVSTGSAMQALYSCYEAAKRGYMLWLDCI